MICIDMKVYVLSAILLVASAGPLSAELPFYKTLPRSSEQQKTNQILARQSLEDFINGITRKTITNTIIKTNTYVSTLTKTNTIIHTLTKTNTLTNIVTHTHNNTNTVTNMVTLSKEDKIPPLLSPAASEKKCNHKIFITTISLLSSILSFLLYSEKIRNYLPNLIRNLYVKYKTNTPKL